MKISLVNSYILYKLEKTEKGEKPLSHLRFLKTLVEELGGSYRQQREQASTSHFDEIRLNGKLHVILKGQKGTARFAPTVTRLEVGGKFRITVIRVLINLGCILATVLQNITPKLITECNIYQSLLFSTYK